MPIDEDLDGGGDLLVVREGGSAPADSPTTVTPSGAMMRDFWVNSPARAPTVHQTDARTDRLIHGLDQAIENADQHELPVALLTHVITQQTRLSRVS